MFPGQQFKPTRRPWTLLNFLFWATLLLSPLFSFVLGVFASGSPLLILTFLGLIGVLVDPTTAGVSDSNRAMTYTEPWVDEPEPEELPEEDTGDD